MIIYVLSMLWALFALWVFLYVSARPKIFEHFPIPVISLIGIGLFFRLIPAFFLVPNPNFDIDSYRLVSQHIVAGEDVYLAEDTIKRYPYLPFQMYWSGFSKIISNNTNIPFDSFVRLAPIFADILIGLLIYFIIQKTPQKNSAFWMGLIYVINPVSIYVSAYHGQFDAIPVAMILLTFIFTNKNNVSLAGFWLGLGVLTKSWPILALAQCWSYFPKIKQKILFCVFVSLIPLAGIFIYDWFFGGQFITVIKRAVTYNNGIGVWGYTYLIRLFGIFWSNLQPFVNSFFNASKFLTLAMIGISWFFVSRKQNLYAGMLTILISFLAFTHAFAIQYLVWLLPFAIIDNQFRWLKWYTLAAFSYMFLAYHTLILRMTITQLIPWPQADLILIIPAGLATWFITLAWIWTRGKESYSLGGKPQPISMDIN